MSISGPAIAPWERIRWPDEQIQVINRDMGYYLYAQKQQLDTATLYFDKALELKNDWRTYYFRSQCKRTNAQTSEALEDALLAANFTTDKNNLVELQECDCIYELNEFEKAYMLLHRKRRLCAGTKISAYEARLCVTKENIVDSIGDALGPFIQENAKIFPKVLEESRRKKDIDPRPLWKILKSQEICDVLSVLEKEAEIISPRERARRERAFKIFNETYLNKSWIDVLFLRSLRKNPTLLLNQTPQSTLVLRALVNNKYQTVYKFLKMLHARCPLYTLKGRFSNKAFHENYLQDHLYRVQNQTRRNMHTILTNIDYMRAQRDINNLCKYVEDVMGSYVVIKTSRIMPWKFVFINEVYNTLALALTDLCVIPNNILSVPFINRKKLVYRLPLEQKEPPSAFVFGDKSTYQDPHEAEKAMNNYRNKILHFEERMVHAKYNIEKCYLLHEIGRVHLTQNRFDECISTAKKACEASKKCKSNIWRFLSQLLIIKSHAQLQRIEKEQESLDNIRVTAKKLRSRKLIEFIDYLTILNESQLQNRRAMSMDISRLKTSSQTKTKSDFSM